MEKLVPVLGAGRHIVLNGHVVAARELEGLPNDAGQSVPILVRVHPGYNAGAMRHRNNCRHDKPRLPRIRLLGSQDELTCSHNLTDLYRGDLLSQAQGYSTLCGAGIMRRNEARVRLDLPPDSDPEADKLTVQAQMVPLVSIGQHPPKPHSVEDPASADGV